MTKCDRIKDFCDFMAPVEVSELIYKLDAMGYFDAPASAKYHGNYEGGLFDHSYRVAEVLVSLTNDLRLKWEREESPKIVGLFHDLCKCDLYEWDIETDTYKYSNEPIDPDHGSKSVIEAFKLLELTDEEIACIRWHMGAYERDTRMWIYYGRAIERYPNVLYTHTADMIASKIHGI